MLAAAAGPAPGGSEQRGGRFSVLTWEQVQRLDQILGEAVPIHGRGNFPTLSVRPRTIVQDRLQCLYLQTCLQQLCSWKDIWLSSRLTETGGIRLESPECKNHPAPASTLWAVLQLGAQRWGRHRLCAGG